MQEPAVDVSEAPGPDERESLRDRITVFQYCLMERAAMRWPERLGRGVFEAYTRTLHAAAPSVRRTVAGNLARVLGRPADSDLVVAAVREAFHLYGRYWYDTFRVRVMPPEEINKRFVIDGLANIDRALEAGRGAILALPHMGNWDVAGRFMSVNGYRLAAVAEQLRPRRIFDQFIRHREALGMRIVPLTEDKRAGLQLAELLADNWLVALVADRDLGGRGVDVEMFGATRKLPAGPALLSIRTGSPLMACPVYTTDDGWFCRIPEPLQMELTGDTRADVTALTTVLARHFERDIAAKPVDWHMFQPGWPQEMA
jgi:phosphatidylinositol dimannoside acyltransferase